MECLVSRRAGWLESSACWSRVCDGIASGLCSVGRNLLHGRSDRTTRLRELSGSKWSTGYAVPQLAYTPQLVSRQYIPNPELPPASVTLKNPGADPLVVQVVDLFTPKQPPEEKIKPNGEVTVQLARESGGVLEEVFLVPGPNGILLEQTARHPIPPQQRYTLTVWADRETYKVLPFKDAPRGAPKSVTEGFSRRTQVSLGVIPVPPGDVLQDGEQMDLILITKRLRNPGAVVHFPKPVDQP